MAGAPGDQAGRSRAHEDPEQLVGGEANPLAWPGSEVLQHPHALRVGQHDELRPGLQAEVVIAMMMADHGEPDRDCGHGADQLA